MLINTYHVLCSSFFLKSRQKQFPLLTMVTSILNMFLIPHSLPQCPKNTTLSGSWDHLENKKSITSLSLRVCFGGKSS